MNRKHLTCIILLTFYSLLPTLQARATTYYVPDDFASIQLALDTCLHNDEIIVRDGTYYEHIVWPSKVGIVLHSENGADHCTIDGGGAGNVVSFTTGIGRSTIVYGFKITNGSNGMAMSGSSPYIHDCTIINNAAHGIAISNASPKIEACLIQNNGQDGVNMVQSSAEINNNTIQMNGGRGIACISDSPSIVGNTIEGNIAGGITLYIAS